MLKIYIIILDEKRCRNSKNDNRCSDILVLFQAVHGKFEGVTYRKNGISVKLGGFINPTGNREMM